MHGDDDHGHDDHEHCEDFLTESDCGMHSECEWHADEMACEDAGSDHDDHEHCEDFLTESDCGMHSECEWHADEMACEDAGSDHDDHEHCEDFLTESDCGMHSECEWHADEMACEDAGSDHDDHEHCEDFLTEADCDMHSECEWHADHCEDAHDHGGDCGDTDHFNTDGLILESDGSEIYSQFQGLITGSVEVHMGHGEEMSVHFLDSDGNEIEVTNPDCYPLSFNVTDPSIISVSMEEGHDDHDHGDDDHGHEDDHGDDDHGHDDDHECDDCMDYCVSYVMENYGYTLEQGTEWCSTTSTNAFGCAELCTHDDDHGDDDHGDDDHGHDDDHGDDDHDEHGALTFDITGLAVGSTTFTISIMHQGHADFTSMPILVTVEEEEHCEDFLTESDCGMHSECEWHADEMACEDAGSDHDDHEHCEDFLTEADCGMHSECEWHADEMACEDAGSDHDDH